MKFESVSENSNRVKADSLNAGIKRLVERKQNGVVQGDGKTICRVDVTTSVPTISFEDETFKGSLDLPFFVNVK